MTFNNNLSAHNRLSTMTATATRLALPITLGDDFPYKEAFLEQLQILCGNDSTWHSAFLAAWLTPEETLQKVFAVEKDLSSVQCMADWVCPEDNFDDNPAVDFPNDNWHTAFEKYLARAHALVENVHPGNFASTVLSGRPGDVTADGREVAK